MSRRYQIRLLERRLREHERTGGGATLTDLLYTGKPLSKDRAEDLPANLTEYLLIASLPPAVAELVHRVWSGEKVTDAALKSELMKLDDAALIACRETIDALAGRTA